MNTNFIDIFAPYIPFFVQLMVLIINVVYIMKATRGNGVSIIGITILNGVIFAVTNITAIAIPSLDGLIQQDIISMLLELIIG